MQKFISESHLSVFSIILILLLSDSVKGQIINNDLILPNFHCGNTYRCRFINDGKQFISSYRNDNFIHDLETGKTIANSLQISDEIIGYQNDTDKLYLFSRSSSENEIIIWDFLNKIAFDTLRNISSDMVLDGAILSKKKNQLILNHGEYVSIHHLSEKKDPIQIHIRNDEYINIMNYSSDLNYILLGTNKKNCYLYDVNTGKKINEKRLFDEVDETYINVNNKHVITHDLLGNTLLWDAVSGNNIKLFPPHEGNNVFTINSSNDLFAFSTSNSTIEVWDFNLNLKIAEIQTGCQACEIKQIGFDSKNRLLFVTKSMENWSYNYTLFLYDYVNNHKDKLNEYLDFFSFAPNSKDEFVIVQTKNGIDLIDEVHQKVKYSISNNLTYVNAINWNNSNLLSISTNNGNCLNLDLRDGKLASVIKKGHVRLQQAQFSNNPNHIYIGNENQIFQWDISTNSPLKIIGGEKLNGFKHFDINDDETQVITCSDDKTIKIWDLNTGKTIKTLAHHDHVVSNVCYSPNENYILSASADKNVVLYDLVANEIKNVFSTDNWPSAHFSSNGDSIFIFSTNRIFIKETISGNDLNEIKSYKGDFIMNYTFNKSGNILAIADKEKVYLIDIIHDRLIGTLPSREITNISFIKNDSMLVTSFGDNSIAFWDIKEMKKTISTFIFGTNGDKIIHISQDGSFTGDLEEIQKILNPSNTLSDKKMVATHPKYTPMIWEKAFLK
jgi:WD40 repeat protein